MSTDPLKQAAQLVKEKRYAEALQLYKGADSALALYGQAGCLFRLGLNREARKAINACLEREPSFTRARKLGRAIDRKLAMDQGNRQRQLIAHLPALAANLSPLWSVLFLGWNSAVVLILIAADIVSATLANVLAGGRPTWEKAPRGSRFGELFKLGILTSAMLAITMPFIVITLHLFLTAVVDTNNNAMHATSAEHQAAIKLLAEAFDLNMLWVIVLMVAAHVAGAFISQGKRQTKKTDVLFPVVLRLMGLTLFLVAVGLPLIALTGYVFPVLLAYVVFHAAYEWHALSRQTQREEDPQPQSLEPTRRYRYLPPKQAPPRTEISRDTQNPGTQTIRILDSHNGLPVIFLPMLAMPLFYPAYATVEGLRLFIQDPAGLFENLDAIGALKVVLWFIAPLITVFFGSSILVGLWRSLQSYRLRISQEVLSAVVHGPLCLRRVRKSVRLENITSLNMVCTGSINGQRLYRIELRDHAGDYVTIVNGIKEDTAKALCECFPAESLS